MNIDAGLLATINVLPEPMLLVDTDGKIHVTNSAAARYLQVPLAELKGLDLGRFVADPPETIRDYLGRCARSGGFLPGAMSIRIADGEPVKHRTFAARSDMPSYTSARPLVLMRVERAHGGNSGFAALNAKIGELSREITRRKRMESDLRRSEQALAEREQQFQLLADNIPNLCWMADETGAIFWYNSRWYEYTGTTPEEMRGWGWQSVHDPKLLPDVLDRWRASIANGTRFEMVFPLRGADGTFRPFLTRIAPLRNAEGQIVRWFGTNVDILEQQNAQEVLRQADRRKDEFLATLAHELRNPLAPLRNAVLLLKAKAADARTYEWATAIIERQVQSMARMLDDLLDVSRVTRGTLTLHRQRVPLASVVEHAIEVAQPLITAHRHHVTVDLPSEPIEIAADPLRLSQIFANLLTNAAKYTDPGGQIALSASRAEGRATVSVTDSGIGLERESTQHIFEMFAQVKSALDRSEGGLGIGLALVKGLAELHGGSVEAQSAGLGKGSRFSVHLPLESTAPTAAEVELPAKTKVVGAVACRVLIADDNKDAAVTLQALLEFDGHEVHIAHDGQAALDAAERLRPQIAILDIGMPKLNGFEVAVKLRSANWGSSIRLIALTGWGQDGDKRRAFAAGFDAHLTKPVDPNELKGLLTGEL